MNILTPRYRKFKKILLVLICILAYSFQVISQPVSRMEFAPMPFGKEKQMELVVELQAPGLGQDSARLFIEDWTAIATAKWS